MGELLNGLEIELLKLNSRNYSKLQEPLGERELDKLFEKLNIQDPDLRKFYEWKNGFDLKSGLHVRDAIFDFGVPVPLDIILNSVEQNLIDNENLIGIVTNCSGDYLLYNRQTGDDFGKIHIQSTSLLLIDNNPVIYDSVVKLVETTLMAYQSGALYYSDDGRFLERDLAKYSNNARTLNTQAKFWDYDFI